MPAFAFNPNASAWKPPGASADKEPAQDVFGAPKAMPVPQLRGAWASRAPIHVPETTANPAQQAQDHAQQPAATGPSSLKNVQHGENGTFQGTEKAAQKKLKKKKVKPYSNPAGYSHDSVAASSSDGENKLPPRKSLLTAALRSERSSEASVIGAETHYTPVNSQTDTPGSVGTTPNASPFAAPHTDPPRSSEEHPAAAAPPLTIVSTPTSTIAPHASTRVSVITKRHSNHLHHNGRRLNGAASGSGEAQVGDAHDDEGPDTRGSPVMSVRVGSCQLSQGHRKSIGPMDFQAIREIGQGAFGKVYLVQNRITRRHYAMKVLNKQRVLQKEQVAYAMGERDVMCTLEHPYLVALRYAFQTNSRLFLVMDYIEGGHLWTHMKSGFLAEDVARVFAAEIALALIHLHALNIAHRDLKPENILLDSDNHCRLTDFGLAKRDLSEDARAHTLVGTVDYMAPEIIREDGHGRSVDWWSLGVLLYEMLFARLPFSPHPDEGRRGGGGKGGGGGGARKDPKLQPGTDEYKREVKRRIQHGKVNWPKGPFVPRVSNAAKNLVQRLLSKSPEARLQDTAVLEHEWFSGIDMNKLRARQLPSPLRSSIFAGPADCLSARGLDMAPIEAPCPKLAGYLFENDTPKGSPRPEMLDSFHGFSFVHENELAMHANAEAALAAAF